MISDLVIAGAYISIPITLIYVIRNRPHSFPNRWIVYMFSTFILLNALMHLVSVLVIWQPVYFSQGILKAAAASVSFATAVLFIPLAPRFMHSLAQNQEAENQKPNPPRERESAKQKEPGAQRSPRRS